MRYIGIIFLLIVVYSLDLKCQHFSHTFDAVQISNERGKGMIVTEEGDIYCTVGLVCQDLSVDCANVYKFNSDGNLMWNRLLTNNKTANWENISIDNDTVYIAGQDVLVDDKRFLDEILLNSETGDSIGILFSEMPPNFSSANFGQLIFNDNIFVYGSVSNELDNFDSPGYIHKMDKQGNYLDHLEYRIDNFNSIYQLMEGPEDFLYFLCSSTSSTDDNYRLIRYEPDLQSTEVIKHFPTQSITDIEPFYTILSDRFIMTNKIFDYPGQFQPIISMVGLSFDGDSLWQYKLLRENLWDLRTYDIFEMVACRNDDYLICGEFENGDSNDSGFIMRFSKDGDLLWERRYRAYDDNGGLKNSYLSAVREMPDGSIVGIGSIQQESIFGSEEDFWILNVGSDGCYQEKNCEDVNLDQWITSTTNLDNEILVSLSPNPTLKILKIKSDEEIILTEIYSIGGNKLSHKNHYTNSITLDVGDFPAGMFYVKIITESGETIRNFIKF